MPQQQIIAALADASVAPDDLRRLAFRALELDLFEQVEARFAAETQGGSAQDPRAWQILGLARRNLQDSAGANAAFARAAALAPDDALIAHSEARTALEAGRVAVALFDRARVLAPADGSVVMGRAAAQLAEGEGKQALRDLADLLAGSPGWIEGHHTYARISAIIAPDADRIATLRTAVKRFPREPGLWQTMIAIAAEAADHRGALELIGEARRALGSATSFDLSEASELSELGEAEAAQRILDRLPPPTDGESSTFPIRNLIRLGRFDEAMRLAQRSFGDDADLPLWPYRALLWRLTGDERWQWLEGDERLIGAYDIGLSTTEMRDLAHVLRQLHRGSGQPLDQSVRRGTQTDGNLLARAEPEIRRLRAAVLDVVASHVAQLPPMDPRHPTLVATRTPLRIAGAWSVRLTASGFHVDHVHYQGWLSSALYVALPEGEGGIDRSSGTEAGWLTFGECRSLLPELKAFRTIEPRVGRLALFPSITWHGTRPFGAGERMTVAFDIVRPRQESQ